jgi:hypothetical protein
MLTVLTVSSEIEGEVGRVKFRLALSANAPVHSLETVHENRDINSIQYLAKRIIQSIIMSILLVFNYISDPAPFTRRM